MFNYITLFINKFKIYSLKLFILCTISTSSLGEINFICIMKISVTPPPPP